MYVHSSTSSEVVMTLEGKVKNLVYPLSTTAVISWRCCFASSTVNVITIDRGCVAARNYSGSDAV
jgi:hypothetical protein